MAVLTDAQLAALAHAAGWVAPDDATAVAVVHPESGCNPDAENSIPCTGLWQVNIRAHRAMIADLMGVRANGPAAGPSIAQMSAWLKNPTNNAHAAYKVWKDEGWHAWTTFNNGSHVKYLAAAKAACAADKGGKTALGSGDDPAIDGTPMDPNVADTSVGGQIRAAINDFTTSLRNTGLLGLVLVTALVLIVLGVILLSRNGVRNVAKKAVSVVPGGAVAQAVLK